MNRIQKVHDHLQANKTSSATTYRKGVKGPNDVVIVSAVRTPIARGRKGTFKDTTADILLKTVLDAIIQQTKIDPTLIGDICIGNVLQQGSGATMARMAQMQAGIPSSVPLNTVNRQCSSGLQAIANVVAGIEAGYYDVAIGGGVESMTRTDMANSAPDVCWEKVYENDEARECATPMGITSENVAEKFGITRQEQDEFARESHLRAARAQENGWFDEEIVPTTVTVETPDGESKDVTLTKDEGIRRDTTVQGLSKLRAAFKEGGSTTAGNSSQVSDGAAAVLVMKRSVAHRLGLRIIAKFVSYAVAGVPPSIMGIGPAVAIPKVLQQVNLRTDDIDIFELNEAFASQALYCVRHLKLPSEKVNPKGGAIALGHPLGCTGARQVATLVTELRRQKKSLGVVSMCIGTGMGAAAVLEVEY